MAHRSRKKHLKHVHQHEPATPPARSPVEKAEAAAAGIAPKRGRRQRGAAPEASAGATRTPEAGKQGFVRRLASKATHGLLEKFPRPSDLASRARERLAEVLPRPRKLVRKAKETFEGKLPRAGELAEKLPSPSQVTGTPRRALARAKALVKARVSRVRSMLAPA